jgi:two-component system cell cycle sensor histidine kinase/response regulator CckA
MADTYKLSQLIDLGAVQKMADSHYLATGMPIGIISALDDSILVGSGWQEICVRFHRAHPVACRRCQESDSFIKHHLVPDKAFQYKCKNGLWDIGMPIIVGGRHLATLFLGQFFYEGEAPERAFFIRQAQAFGFDRDDYLAALDRVPTFTREKVDLILEYDMALARFIADLAGHSLSNIIAEKQLRLSEEKFRRLFSLSSDALFLIENESGEILEINDAAQRQYGFSRDELIGMKNTDLSAEPHQTRKATVSRYTHIPVRYHRKKDGTVFPVEIIASHLEWNGKEAHLASIRDISFRIQAEKERTDLAARLQRAQKLESIGNLAGGIAHDFNNILTSIIGYSELALVDSDNQTNLKNHLKEVLTAAKRAKELVKQVLAFARQSDEAVKPIRVDIIAKEALRLIRSSIPTTIEIEQDISNSRPILGNPTQVHQIFMNLCTNAAQAMTERGGVLAVRIDDVMIEKEIDGRGLDLAPGFYLRISVSDTGTGIAPDVIGNIFDPYFTTKGLAEGTGMGLAVVHGIVESYGGKIAVESQLNQGTCFTLYLPCALTPLAPPADPPAKLPTGTERVLIVDDEDPVLDVNSKILEHLGYTVTACRSSFEALELFRAKPHDFDLVLTDMTMPRMTGDKLAAELVKIRPDIAVILCTGYNKKITDEGIAEAGIKAVSMKPLVMSKLATIVRNVLDDTAG